MSKCSDKRALKELDEGILTIWDEVNSNKVWHQQKMRIGESLSW